MMEVPIYSSSDLELDQQSSVLNQYEGTWT